MALTVYKSMEISDFWACWQHITALVKAEYQAVKGHDGGYSLHLELMWDCEEEIENESGGSQTWPIQFH